MLLRDTYMPTLNDMHPMQIPGMSCAARQYRTQKKKQGDRIRGADIYWGKNNPGAIMLKLV